MKIKNIYGIILATILFTCLIYGCVKRSDNFDSWAESCDAAKGRQCNYHEVEVYARNH